VAFKETANERISLRKDLAAVEEAAGLGAKIHEVNTDIFDEDANSVPLGYGGNIVNKTPWPH
jgi:hypothetical protein